MARGSCISKIVGNNVARLAGQDGERWHGQVSMWVYEEMVGGEKLTEIINSRHENVKYSTEAGRGAP